jgi:hypothetical protein
LRASIRSFVERELSMFTTDEGYELRVDDDVIATLGNPKFQAEVECVTADGSWTFVRLVRGHTEARRGTATVARYSSGLLPGGRIELGSDGIALRLRPPVTGETWRVRRGFAQAVMIRAPQGPWEITFGRPARDIYELPLLTMFAFHAMLVEIDRPAGGSPTPGT